MGFVSRVEERWEEAIGRWRRENWVVLKVKKESPHFEFAGREGEAKEREGVEERSAISGGMSKNYQRFVSSLEHLCSILFSLFISSRFYFISTVGVSA
jgi:hypothetical protein